MFHSKFGLTFLLFLVFAANLLETSAEQRFGPGASRISAKGYRFASAMRGLESRVGLEKFENHDATSRLAVYGYSISYFFLFPLLCLGVALALLMRPDIVAYRILCLSVALDYLFSLGFFLFMPVPERWAFPDSGAVLLSDLWSSQLIENIRPISALDNCFPSTHVSLMIILILACFLFQVRLRMMVLMLGLTVILATFVLGVHWLPDMAAGVAVACLSVVMARSLEIWITDRDRDSAWRPACR